MDQGKKRAPLDPLLKYSSLAIQMLAMLALAGWAGMKLDAALELKFPVFLLTLILLAFAGMIYRLYTGIGRDS